MSNFERLSVPIARVIVLAGVLISGSLMAGQFISRVEQLEKTVTEQKDINREILKELGDIKIQLAQIIAQGKREKNGR